MEQFDFINDLIDSLRKELDAGDPNDTTNGQFLMHIANMELDRMEAVYFSVDDSVPNKNDVVAERLGFGPNAGSALGVYTTLIELVTGAY